MKTIQEFYNWMAERKKHGRKANLNEQTIARVGGFVSRLFKLAIEMGIVRKNSVKVSLLRNPGDPDRHHKALEDEEIMRIKKGIGSLAAAEERLYMGLPTYMGMRLQENRES